MSLFHALTVKPWATPEGAAAEPPRASFLPSEKIGLRVLMVVITVAFSLLIVAYHARMALGDWLPLPEPALLWLNTGLLVLASAAFQRTWKSAREGRIEGVRTGLLVAGVFTFAFLAGQLLVWQQMVTLGYFAETNPANGFFFLLTALHGLHMLGGLVAWGRTTAKVRRGLTVGQVQLSVELCTIYWHFLLVVWLVIFGLFLYT